MNTEQASKNVFTHIVNRIFNMPAGNKEIKNSTIKKEQHVARIFHYKDLERVIAIASATAFLFK